MAASAWLTLAAKAIATSVSAGHYGSHTIAFGSIRPSSCSANATRQGMPSRYLPPSVPPCLRSGAGRGRRACRLLLLRRPSRSRRCWASTCRRRPERGGLPRTRRGAWRRRRRGRVRGRTARRRRSPGDHSANHLLTTAGLLAGSFRPFVHSHKRLPYRCRHAT